MQKVALLPAIGIGDAILMMIASHQLRLAGCDVTTFHNSLPELSPWFPVHRFEPLPPRDALIETLSSFDKIIVENDNSSTISLLRSAFGATTQPKLSIFYPSYSLSKHGPLSNYDQVFLPHLSMAENIARAIGQLMEAPTSKENGIVPPYHLIHRRHRQRIVIHPTSRVAQKNWIPERFVAVAQKLQNRGFTPVFSVAPQEIKEWQWIEKRGFALPALASLTELAALIYESGYVIGNDSLAGHLASNLDIPTLIIANDPKRMRLWQPGWLPGALLFPPSWVPNFKGFRWRDKHWQRFITVRAALKRFESLINSKLM